MKTYDDSFEPMDGSLDRSSDFERHEILQRAPPSREPTKPAFRFEIEADRILSLAELEKAYLAQVIRDTKCSKERMAELLGINRKTLYRKQKEYNL